MTVCGSYVGLSLFVSILMTIVDGQFTVDLRLGEQHFYNRGTHHRVCENSDVNITCFTIESCHFTSISINRGTKQLQNSTEDVSVSIQDRLPEIEKKENYTCDLYLSSINYGKFNLTLKITAVLPLDYLKEEEEQCSNDNRKTSDRKESGNPTDLMQNSTRDTGEDDAQNSQNNDEPAQSTGCQHEFCLVNLDLFPKRFTYGSKCLKFVCTSDDPAAPMFWAIVGKKGNILDQHNVNTSLEVDTNIAIYQSLGKTSIEVVESASGSNGIHTVICATYGSYLGVATAHSDMPETTISSTSFSVSEESSVTSEFSSRTISTSTNDIPEVYNQRAATNSQPSISSMDMSIVKILSGLGLVITILIIAGIVVAFLHHKKEKPPKDTQDDVIYDVLYPDTVLTRNPAYQSYDDDGLGPPPCLPPVNSQASPYKDPGRDVYSYIDDSEKPKEDESDGELTKQPTPIS